MLQACQHSALRCLQHLERLQRHLGGVGAEHHPAHRLDRLPQRQVALGGGLRHAPRRLTVRSDLASHRQQVGVGLALLARASLPFCRQLAERRQTGVGDPLCAEKTRQLCGRSDHHL